MDFRSLIANAYKIYPSRIDLPDSLNDGRFYDYALFLPKEETRETMTRLIQDGIEKQFQLTITFETRLMDVYVLTAPNGKGLGRNPIQEIEDRQTHRLKLGS
jgi:uncharacterized protein (TIGR03435 family)